MNLLFDSRDKKEYTSVYTRPLCFFCLRSTRARTQKRETKRNKTKRKKKMRASRAAVCTKERKIKEVQEVKNE